MSFKSKMFIKIHYQRKHKCIFIRYGTIGATATLFGLLMRCAPASGQVVPRGAEEGVHVRFDLDAAAGIGYEKKHY